MWGHSQMNRRTTLSDLAPKTMESGSPGRNQKKCFQGGNGATAPPFWHDYFQLTRKRGWGFDPSQIFGPATETYCQHAAKHRKTPQNTAKHRKMPQNATKHRKTPQNAAKHRKTPQNTAKRHKRTHGRRQFVVKCCKSPPNTAKHRQTPQSTAKHRKTPQIL